jgi:hypothetical protein
VDEDPMQRHQAITEALALIFQAVEDLKREFPDREFTPDGRMVGDLGEVIAWLEYDLRLDDTRRPGHDATTSDGRRVQIKATFQDQLVFKTVPGHYLGFKLYPNGRHEEIFNGPAQIIHDHYVHRKGIGKKLLSFPVSVLCELSRKVQSADRIPKRKT